MIEFKEKYRSYRASVLAQHLGISISEARLLKKGESIEPGTVIDPPYYEDEMDEDKEIDDGDH